MVLFVSSHWVLLLLSSFSLPKCAFSELYLPDMSVLMTGFNPLSCVLNVSYVILQTVFCVKLGGGFFCFPHFHTVSHDMVTTIPPEVTCTTYSFSKLKHWKYVLLKQ